MACKRRRGAATVEFALLAPLLSALLLGSIEISRQIIAKQALSDAARAGCRAGVLPGSDNAAISAAVTAVLAKHGLGDTSPLVTVLVNDQSADAATARQDQSISVEVSLPFSSVSWMHKYVYTSGSTLQSEKVVMMRQG